MRIIWLSANRLGHELLKEAVKIKSAEIKAVITLSEKAKTVMYDSVARGKWDEFGIPVKEVENINESIELIKKISPELVIMCGWRQIVGREILEIPKKGFVGFHPTLLPKGRGPAPIINSILSGFRESGVTMFYAAEGLDNGDIIGQEKFFIENDDYAEDVYEKVIEGGRKLVKRCLPMLIAGNAPRIRQDESKATMFKKRTLEDNEIKPYEESAEEIYRKIRALSKPYNGAFIKKDGKKIVIWKAEIKDG